MLRRTDKYSIVMTHHPFVVSLSRTMNGVFIRSHGVKGLLSS
jgi:hypothetical protein